MHPISLDRVQHRPGGGCGLPPAGSAGAKRAAGHRELPASSGRFPIPPPQDQARGRRLYAPAPDIVQVPEPKRFVTAEAYHATLFHELIHATGHPMRLTRFSEEEKARFGDESYSKEELVAEMGASFLCAFTGIREQVFPNSVAYLQGWVSKFKDDKTMLLYAAARAFKAASFILGLKTKEQQEVPPQVKAAA
ncbi:zincin-like metallopeptidase domain-containing protein [Pontibacter mangrovi]|uniref:zincin-like metallopeptidase domain-containing protein n=1 Tax=Pontibacter mangrovi TaxID=2589816 RepID=UPI0021D30829|nr:zincin-like metallopeptidase domain-containing protein [Pontibacter mangrovi]